MRLAGFALLVSAALHVLGVGLAGFAPEALILFGPAILYVALFLGLSRGKVWVAWIAFICMLGGMAGTVAELAGASMFNTLVLWGILAADAVAAVLLFRALWAGRPGTPS